MDMSEKIIGVVVGLIGGLIVLTVGIIVGGATDHQQNLTDKALAQKVLQSSIEMEWSSPTEIKQIFWVEDRSYGNYFWCDTDTGNGNSAMYKLPYRSRAPRVGEWWKLAIDENGNKYLYTPDWDKTKKENGGELP